MMMLVVMMLVVMMMMTMMMMSDMMMLVVVMMMMTVMIIEDDGGGVGGGCGHDDDDDDDDNDDDDGSGGGGSSDEPTHFPCYLAKQSVDLVSLFSQSTTDDLRLSGPPKAKTPVAGLEPESATERSLQIPGRIRYLLCYRRPSTEDGLNIKTTPVKATGVADNPIRMTKPINNCNNNKSRDDETTPRPPTTTTITATPVVARSITSAATATARV
ncbi:hypothetical protein PoB_001387600 [Plakobranchus ocellatus]|uniref:Uncharacterized protein n=1 Tax=Plakobranchus ocellatus TaxID=259542 RepID=A0AAV3YYB9_9GAST|nr:hypothetical protein PoB_001387600 [Plakobranchus ocellatus]